MSITRAARTAAAIFLTFFAGTAGAEDVTLTSRDGSIEVTGTLLSFDGEFYRVETQFGPITVDGSGVICDGPGCPSLEAYVAEVQISGARSIGAVLMPALIETFAARNGYRTERKVEDDTHFTYVLTDEQTGATAARIGFRIATTAEGFADLLAREADIVMALREPTDAELARGEEAGLGDLSAPGRSLVIGLDGLVPVVSPRNPVREITVADLADVFSGEITRWDALGGPAAPIRLHLRNQGSGLADLFQTTVLSPALKLPALTVSQHGSNEVLADAVARDPRAIGISSYSAIGNAVPLTITGGCGIRSPATPTTLKTEDYPFTAPLFLYLPPQRLPVLVRELLGFMRSPGARAVIRRAGFVDLGTDEMPLAVQGDRFANAILSAGEETTLADLKALVRGLEGGVRLTYTFRFRDGTAELDPQSLSNVSLLASSLEAGTYDDHPLVFIGFSDGNGGAEGNLRLARERAEAVRSAVLEEAPFADRTRISLRIRAFGEALPMACDDTDWGGRINRRVEVWSFQR
jgi:phosphate transport system substrate-binding protein